LDGGRSPRAKGGEMPKSVQKQNNSSALGSVLFWFVVSVSFLILLILFHFSYMRKQEIFWWSDVFSILINIGSGIAVSFVFYYLVVYLPARRRRRLVKRNVLKMYRNIKRDMLLHILLVSARGGRTDAIDYTPEVEKLMDPGEFNKLFSGENPGINFIGAFENQIYQSECDYSEFNGRIKMLHRQVEYLLNFYDAFDDESLYFFLKTKNSLLSLEVLRRGYNESEKLSLFVSDVFAGWDYTNEYRGYDRIERAIQNLQE
jgi:hypothetical protein